MELRAAAPLLLLLCLPALLPACSRESEPLAESPAGAPAGIIQELAADASITTDVNARSPAFVRTGWDDRIVRTQDYLGEKVILLDFWSVFCQSCIEEIPFLIELHERYSGQGLEVISVNTDFFPKARIASFMKKVGMDLPFTLIHDRDQSLSKLFSVDALPVGILIDSSGWIRMVHLGYRPEDEKKIEARVQKACRRINDAVVTLQPVEGKTAFSLDGKSDILQPGTAVPDFQVRNSDGEIVSFSRERQGDPALVFMWSLFCQPCREEIPELLSLAGRFGRRGLRTFAVNVDSEKLFEPALRFSRKEARGLDHYFDSAGESARGGAAAALGVSHTPSIFLVDSNGTVAFSAAGKISAELIAAKMEELVTP